MPDNKEKDLTSAAFDAATKLTDEEIIMSEYDRYAIDQPFKNHRIYTAYDISKADIDRILRPILQTHGIPESDYDVDKLSYKIGEKTVQLSLNDYEYDSEFEAEMKFIRKEVDIKKTISVSNRCSIQGTEILVDFLKSFQSEYPQSYFEIVKDAYMDEADLQKFYINGELMYDPDGAWLLEIEDPEAYLQELENGNR